MGGRVGLGDIPHPPTSYIFFLTLRFQIFNAHRGPWALNFKEYRIHS
jgi:hypothetical protein